jgi:outer membrane protein OmpA-like peptidoglycan-associated protein
MKILIIGFIVFVIWSLFSVWLYVNKIKPVQNDQVIMYQITESQTIVADTAVQSEALIPNDLTIYFEFDDAGFQNDSQKDTSVVEFKTWLDKHPESMLSITGHTDNIGTSEYNQTLGFKRARTIQKYLESRGINADKMILESKGKDQPIIVDQTTEEGRAKNRRVVITINK